MRILLVEDNERLAELVAAGLKQHGFAADAFSTVADAAQVAETIAYDLMVLDLGLPDGDGLDLLRRLRSQGKTLPVLVLTARDGIEDRVRGLDSGADDYLLKPFAMEELVARLRALLRRSGDALGVVLSCNDLSFDPASRQVRVGDTVLGMPRRETELLEQLLRRVGRVVTKRALEEGLYGFDDEGSANSIEVLVSRLRKRLTQASAKASIHTLRGVGYMLVDAVDGPA